MSISAPAGRPPSAVPYYRDIRRVAANLGGIVGSVKVGKIAAASRFLATVGRDALVRVEACSTAGSLTQGCNRSFERSQALGHSWDLDRKQAPSGGP